MAIPPAVPPVAALLNPATVITATFSPDGTITVVRSALSDDGTSYQPVGDPEIHDATNTTINFEFGVDPGADPKNPQSGLLVERFDDWSYPWDDELARVLGGSPYPYGTAPLPKGENSDWGIQPQNKFGGVFSGPLAVGAGSQIVTMGVCGSTGQALADGGPVKHMSLWLPVGATGYVNFTPASKSVKTFSAASKPVKPSSTKTKSKK